MVNNPGKGMALYALAVNNGASAVSTPAVIVKPGGLTVATGGMATSTLLSLATPTTITDIVIVKPPPTNLPRIRRSPGEFKLTCTHCSAFAVISCGRFAPAVIVVNRASSTQNSFSGLLL